MFSVLFYLKITSEICHKVTSLDGQNMWIFHGPENHKLEYTKTYYHDGSMGLVPRFTYLFVDFLEITPVGKYMPVPWMVWDMIYIYTDSTLGITRLLQSLVLNEHSDDSEMNHPNGFPLNFPNKTRNII